MSVLQLELLQLALNIATALNREGGVALGELTPSAVVIRKTHSTSASSSEVTTFAVSVVIPANMHSLPITISDCKCVGDGFWEM